MNDKYAKKISEELKLIRRELQKMNKPINVEIDADLAGELTYDEMKRNYEESRG
ncbi:hypothetical protein ACDX78_13500 [Virgibacillus oceani]